LQGEKRADADRYLPAIGRFLIVVTFLEDALRIITQWGDQLLYLHDYRHSTKCRFAETS
jgi:SURF4 family